MYLSARTAHSAPYDVCLVHLADARYYPLFQRQAFTLRDAGYRVALVSWEREAGQGDPHWEGVDVYPVTIPVDSFSGKLFFLRYLVVLTRLLRRLPARLYQAVDPVTLPPVRIAAARHKSRYNYFSLEYFQGTEQMVGRPHIRYIWYVIERWGLGRAVNTAVVCRESASRLAQRFGIGQPHVIRNVPPAAEYTAAPDGGLRRAAGIGPEVITAVFKGDIGGGRGLLPFARAMAQVPDLHLAVLGEGPLRPDFEALCCSLGIADRVHILGRVAPGRFAALLKDADLGHCLHENIGENMPYTLPSKLFDYLHAGLPVICGNAGEMAQIVRERRVGWSVDPGDDAALAAALHEAAQRCRDPALRGRAAAAAADFCWEHEQRLYLQFIGEALPRPAA